MVRFVELYVIAILNLIFIKIYDVIVDTQYIELDIRIMAR